MAKLYIQLIIIYATLISQHINAQDFDKNKSYPYKDLGKTGVYFQNTDQHSLQDIDSAFYYLNEAYKLNKTWTETEYILFYYKKGALLYMDHRHSDTILTPLIKGLDLADKLNYTFYQYKLNAQIAVVHADNYVKAEPYLTAAYESCKQLNSNPELIDFLTELANAKSLDAKKNKEALEDLKKVKELLNTTYLKDTLNVPYIKYYLAKANADTTLENQIFDLEKAIEVSIALNAPHIQHDLLISKSTVYQNFDQPQKALKAFKQAERFAIDINHAEWIKDHDLQRANILYLLEDYKQARYYFERALSSPETIRDLHINIDELGYDIYKSSNLHHKAIKYLEKLYDQQRVLQKSSLDSIYVEYENRYQTDKVKADLQLANATLQQKQIERYYSIALVVLLISILLLYFYYRTKHNKTILNSTKEILNKEKAINDYRKRFIENITHEIRTPLTLIKGVFESSLSNNESDNDNNLLEIGYLNSKRLHKDMNNLLLLLKTESLELKSKPEETALLIFFTEIISQFELNLNSKQIHLTLIHNLTDYSHAKIDRNKLEIVLSNLLSNAIKYSEESGKIIIQISAQEHHLNISVKDHGEGIPDQDINHIFERFYQAKNAKSGGIGVGLALVKDIIDSLHGEIKVQSQKDKETEFKITIPLQVSKVLHETITKDFDLIVLQNEHDKANKPKILVVDDNEMMIEFYRQILPDYFNCDFAFDGEQALNKIKHHNYECLISDIMMPKSDGFKLMEQLKQLEDKSDLPVIFVTSNELKSIKTQSYQIGVHDYLEKPFNIQELITRTQNLIRNYSVRKEEQEAIKTSNHGEISFEYDSNPINNKQLQKIISTIEKNYTNPKFKIKTLAEEMFYSERQLSRIIKNLTGLTPTKLILEIRLLKAYDFLISDKSLQVQEVQYKIGIQGTSYFNRVFKSRFGITPKQIRQQH